VHAAESANMIGQALQQTSPNMNGIGSRAELLHHEKSSLCRSIRWRHGPRHAQSASAAARVDRI
jgi:hypothetical protein